jgi:hypothetical protein
MATKKKFKVIFVNGLGDLGENKIDDLDEFIHREGHERGILANKQFISKSKIGNTHHIRNSVSGNIEIILRVK